MVAQPITASTSPPMPRSQASFCATNCSTKLKPNAASVLDSRGLVQLRLGRFDEAIEDYDAALKDEPLQAPSLFGRGLAELRKGAKAQGEADMAAAETLCHRAGRARAAERVHDEIARLRGRQQHAVPPRAAPSNARAERNGAPETRRAVLRSGAAVCSARFHR